MIKQLSSMDIHFLLGELKSLEAARVDKIYNVGKEEICIQLYKTDIGKKILRIIVSKGLFITQTKLADEKPSEFCMLLRRKLGGKALDSVNQIEPERILRLIFKTRDDTKKLYLEFFGKGNVILCDKDNIILDSLIRHKFKDRATLPKFKYEHPRMKYNIFSLNKNSLRDLIKNSKKHKIVTTLAADLGLGGVYAEEVCLISYLDKNKEPKKVDNEIPAILKSIKKLIDKKINSEIIHKNKETVDAVPIHLEYYKSYDAKNFPDFNEALNHYFTNKLKYIKEKESPYFKKINELKMVIERQKEDIKALKQKEKGNREKAELIYKNYQMLKEIIDEINKAKEKHSWEEIKKKLKEHEVIKEVDTKEKKIIVEV